MELTRAHRAAGEDYASAEDLLCAEDCPAYDVRVPHWRSAGRVLLLRVRAPSLAQQEAIHREAKIAAVRKARRDAAALGGGIPWAALLPADGCDWETFCLATLRECVVAPQLNEAQARQFAKKNPDAVESLVTFIWALVELDEAAIAAHVRALAGDAPSDDAPAPDGDDA